jgi:hypothetical protein
MRAILNIVCRIVVLVLAAGLAACQSNSSTSKFGSNVESQPKQVKICSGFGCTYKQTLAFYPTDMEHIHSVLNDQVIEPSAEREALSKLVAWKEIRAQQSLHMRQDTKLSYQRHAGIRGQMDCVDESNNTLAFLKFLDSEQLLKFHHPMQIGARGLLFDGRYPHKTAVVKDNMGTKWAIDSWKKDGGFPPQIVEYARWKAERGSEYR